MRTPVSRTVARPAEAEGQDYVIWWSTALWGAAAAYLLATFVPY
jgi:hypothetical protein